MRPSAAWELRGSSSSRRRHQLRRHPVLAPFGRFGRQHLQRSPALARQPRPLGLRPVLEFPAPIQVEAVQEWRGVARDRPGRIVLLQRGGERFHVARDHGGIEAELDRSEEELARVEITAEGVAGLLEESAAVLGVGFGPQGGDELVAAEAALARGGKEGEQRQRLPLLGRAGRQGCRRCLRRVRRTS